MKIRRQFLFSHGLLALSLLVSTSAFGAPSPKKEIDKKPIALAAGTAPDFGPVMSVEELNKAISEAQARGSRGTANVDVGAENELSDSFRNLRSEIIGGHKYANGKETAEVLHPMSTPDQLHELLKRLNDDNYFNKLAPDAQFAAAQMAPLIVMHSFFNRSVPLIEPSPISHYAVVSMLRNMAAGVMIYLPTEQWKAGIEYLVMPSDQMGHDIVSENDLHVFITNELIPANLKMVKRLRNLNFSSKPIYFDNKVFFGAANFSDEQDRYVRIGEPERYAALARTYGNLTSLATLSAYNINGLFKVVDLLSKSAGYSTLFGFNPEKTRASERFAIIRKVNASDGLFNLRAGGASWMNGAETCFNNAVAFSTVAWKELKARSGDNASMNDRTNPYGVLLDPRAVIGPDRILTAAASNLQYIVKGNPKEPIRSAVVNTEGLQIDLHNFFSNPPKSLVSLMPTAFDPSPYNMTSQINGKSRQWHNYLSGRPVGWSMQEYQKIFPQVHNNVDIHFAARVLSQSWGGWTVGIPMSAFLL